MTKLSSMTGFAACSDTDAGVGWSWEARSVNGRGLELRFRLPPGLDSLESELRMIATRRLTRGTVSATLRLQAAETAGVVVDRVLLARLAAEASALAAERPGTPSPRIELLMALPGVVRRDNAEGEALHAESATLAVKAGFVAVIDRLAEARLAEGARLAGILWGLLDKLALLHTAADQAAAAQAGLQRYRLGEAVGRVAADWPAVTPDRLAQELALLASRSDVTEEIDRLASHLAAARGLLEAGGPAGRQLDFLVQEFMREANTLCSKSASIELTAIGLQIKGVIEQVREQVQNIE